jgi:hypothetical protein
MDSAGIEIPKAASRFDRRLTAVALAATAAACVAGGYALGTSSDGGSPTETSIAHATPSPWEAAVRESVVLKRHATAAERAAAIGIRMKRVER